jgi:UTP--glucose-1-phosphate uridylyltransferase
MIVTKAIIPAAGLGTRFLPATKTIPKEMIPLVDKPAIQYVVEEGVKSGIKCFVLVTGRHKGVMEDHFDIHPELESILDERAKKGILGPINSIIQNASFLSVRQKEPLGLGHAILTARHAIGKEYVSVFLPDDIITGSVPGMAQLIKVASQEKCSVIAVQEVPMSEVSRYGIISIKKQFSPNLFQVKQLIEKPKEKDAPSNLAIIGRYVLSPGIFDALEETRSGAIGEIQLTDGIQNLLHSGERVFAYKIQGTRYDTGTILGWLQANISFALKHPQYAGPMMEYLQKLDKDFLVMEGKAESFKHRAII